MEPKNLTKGVLFIQNQLISLSARLSGGEQQHPRVSSGERPDEVDVRDADDEEMRVLRHDSLLLRVLLGEAIQHVSVNSANSHHFCKRRTI